MFAKPYKLKSNNTLKNSEKKHLAQRIHSCFPTTTDEKIKEIVPVKSNTSCMKLILHSGDTVGVYVVDGTPMIIEVEDKIFPTVCALWKVPDLVPSIAIHTPVLSKIQGGAPLYAPGVASDSLQGKHFNKGTIISVCTVDNYAAGAVGKAAMSSIDLARFPMGVCLDTLHVFGDMLCKENKFNKLERPNLKPPTYADDTNIIEENMAQLNIQPIKEEWPSLVKEKITPMAVVNEPHIITDELKSPSNEEENTEEVIETDLNDTIATEGSDADEDAVPTDMDGLLRWCLLTFLKHQASKVELPLKTNLFYKNYLIPLCPENWTLDVKKSSYKKMSKFLEAMQREGLVETREVERGVDALVSLRADHPLVRAHRAPRTRPRVAAAAAHAPPQIRELYCVTAAVSAALAPHRKGTALAAGEVRATLVEYVRARELAPPARRGAVALDDTLAQAAGRRPQEILKWEELMSAVLNRMTSSTEMVFPDGTHKLIKSKLEPIQMQVATRSGNKKVTLVSNLEAFGFNLLELAQACQHGAAASCGVTRSAGAKADQLLLQGDQTHFVAKLLIEKYGLPKKFLEGADKALNKKNR